MVRLAACCRPLPGEPIVGYITRGRGVSVHHIDCPNAIRYKETEPERVVEVHWGDVSVGVFSVEIEALCINRDRLVMDIMNIMAETKTTVTGVRVTVDKKKDQCDVFLKLEVKSLDHFEYIKQRVARVRGVLEVDLIAHRQRRKK